MNKVLTMTQEEFEAAIEGAVEKKLSSKEEADARHEAEEALKEAKETFESLKAALEARDAKIKEYEEAFANIDTSEPTAAEVAANERIVELEKEVEEWKQTATVTQAALDTIAREETAAGRMAELEEAGVALDEANAETQYAKVRDLTEEAFESYKSELIALKSKYYTPSEEVVEEDSELAQLSADEINMIAQSLGCDPADSKCISLVSEVAAKMSEVSRNRKNKVAQSAVEKTEEKTEEVVEKAKEVTPKKETASVTLSLGEAISKAVDQHFQAPADLKEEISNEWRKLDAAKREKKEKS